MGITLKIDLTSILMKSSDSARDWSQAYFSNCPEEILIKLAIVLKISKSS